MDIQSIKNVVTRTAGLGLLQVKKHSPIILTSAGIVGGVTATVLACKATLKLEPIVEDLNGSVAAIKENKNRVDLRGKPLFNEKEYARNLAFLYTRGTIDIVKLYGPAVSLGVVSIGCIVSAQGIMQRRNAALVAAYTALEKGFNEYRKRVANAVGEDAERELRYGLRTEDVHNTKDGVVEQVSVADPNAISIYARFFDETSSEWTKTPEYNLLFLKCQQQYANDLLHSRGHVFLNEVYDSLGLERSKAGQVVGWVMSKNGDNFVDFGLYRGERDVVREFVNGRERSILLDFNVDGVIYDKI